ncbi:MAG: hypothetical protein Q8N80_00570 [Candidatus Omnitrophota bacterium]|nr:hypothetical protein [Candidatus Omnitrophota bacterium]
MHKQISYLIVSLFFLLCLPVLVFAEESITITTYYPSPYGVYRELRSQRMAIGDNYITGGTYDWEAYDGDPAGEIDYLADLVVEGNVGIGTTSPVSITHLYGADPTLNIQSSGTGVGNFAGIRFKSTNNMAVADYWNAGIFFERTNEAFNTGGKLHFAIDATELGTVATTDAKMTILQGGNVGIGTTGPLGKLDVNGTIFQRGASLHADYVFEPSYKLESIDDHSAYMWQNKHLKAVPVAAKDREGQDIVNWGERNRGVLEELEKAHVYIQQCNERIKALEMKVSELEAKK